MISSRNLIEIYEFIFITFIVKTIHSFVVGAMKNSLQRGKNAKKLGEKRGERNVLTAVNKKWFILSVEA